MQTTTVVDVNGGAYVQGQAATTLTVLQDGFQQFGKGLDYTVTISGLEIGGIYDLFLYSLSNEGNEASFGTFRTTNSNLSGNQIIDGRPGRNGTTFVEGQNYAEFNSIVANVDGEISFTADAHDPNEIDPNDPLSYRLIFSGLQINQVPEPSTALLGGLGLLALLRRRR